jgi:predicted acetyltransferase
MDGITIRSVTDDEFPGWLRAMDYAFLLPTPDGAEAYTREIALLERSLGAFAGAGCVATLRTLDLTVTVPGGAWVGAEGITNVAVVQAYRRRGLLSQMMRMALDEAVARGNALAALIAAEYWIYGRYGFGPATRTMSCEIDVRRARGIELPAATPRLSVEPIGLDEVRRSGPGLYERFRRIQPGAINRTEARWRQRTGVLRNPYRPALPSPLAVVCRDDGGEPAGMALFRADDAWRGGDPDLTITVDDFFAANPAASAALWRHLLTMDWVTRVTAGSIAPDDPLPLLLGNPRAFSLTPRTGQDHLWLRVLDVPAALSARCYDAAGRLVLDVTDRLGYAAGRFAIEAGADGRASVSRTTDAADLTLDVAALGTVYLGDRTPRELAAAGQLTELRSGAVARADRIFRTSVRPWCPDGF